MKVGDYVRTPYGIRKVKEIRIKDNYLDDGFYVEDKYIVCGHKAMQKVKSSPNIIDLIEVGDVITFGYVYTQTKEVKNIKVHRIKNEADLTLQKFYFNYKKRTLKSIVTKEQFESMEYKIGE